MDEGLHMQNPRLRAAINEWWTAYNRADKEPVYALESVGENDAERAFLRKWEHEFAEYAAQCDIDRYINEERCYFAWRWHYADAMLKARKEAQP